MLQATRMRHFGFVSFRHATVMPQKCSARAKCTGSTNPELQQELCGMGMMWFHTFSFLQPPIALRAAVVMRS